MRARSYICLLISKAIIFYLLYKLKLPKCNVLDDGGELFGILINKNDMNLVKSELAFIKKEIIRQFDGNINILYTTKESITKDELMKDSSVLMKDLSEGLYKNEFNQFNDIHDMLSVETFGTANKKISTCSYCGRDFDVTEGKDCSLCQKEFLIGSKLPKAEYIIMFVGSDNVIKEDDFYITFFSKVGLILCGHRDGVYERLKTLSAEYIDIASVNSTEFIQKPLLDGEKNISYSFTTIGNAAPIINGEIIDFDTMKGFSNGAEYLSAMKMDADNFGKVTTEGFGAKTSLLRIATISAYFKYFFQGYLTNKVIEAKNTTGDYRYYGYTVYSGGDDLFLIAPWDKMIDLSLAINDEFQKFTGNNEFLSLTGGIATFTGTIPIKRIGKLAGDEESKAKRHLHGDGTKKNSVAAFGKVYKWDEIKDMLKDAKGQILDAATCEFKHPFGSSLIYDLYKLSERSKTDLCAIPEIYHRMRNNPEILALLHDYLIVKQTKFHFLSNYCLLLTR